MRRVLLAILIVSSLCFSQIASADDVTADADAAAAPPDAVLVADLEVLPQDAGAVVAAPVEGLPAVETEPVPAEVTVEIPPVVEPPATVNEYWLTILVTIVGGMLSWALALFSKWISSRTKNERVQAIIAQATDAAQTAVASVQQVTVAGLKAANADGKLTKDEAKVVLADALTATKTVLGDKGLAVLKSAIDLGEKSADAWLSAKIEAEVSATKPTPAPVETKSGNQIPVTP